MHSSYVDAHVCERKAHAHTPEVQRHDDTPPRSRQVSGLAVNDRLCDAFRAAMIERTTQPNADV